MPVRCHPIRQTVRADGKSNPPTLASIAIMPSRRVSVSCAVSTCAISDPYRIAVTRPQVPEWSQLTEFVPDSPLEEDRFELLVPPKTPGVRAVALSRSRRLSLAEKPLPDLLGALRRFGIGAQPMSRPSGGIPRYGDVEVFRLGGGALQT